MNNIVKLKGPLQSKSRSGGGGPRNIPKNAASITSEKISLLVEELKKVKDFWGTQGIIQGCLVDVYYISVIAKSNRTSTLLSGNDSVVGARFVMDEDRKHVITHYVDQAVISNSILILKGCIDLLDAEFSGKITNKLISELGNNNIDYSKYGLSKTSFINTIADTHYIKGFDVPDNKKDYKNNSIITLYKTSTNLIDLMKKIGIEIKQDKVLNDTTLLLYPNEIKLINEKVPYLIAMSTEDISKMSYDNLPNNEITEREITIEEPANEPIIGVIDTLFDESVYFSDWVEYKKMTNDEIPEEPKDYFHGTTVSSIIVDGPTINPALDDGCGNFRVRHFGVASSGRYSAFYIVKSIEEIVLANPDIRVWNLSLGSDREINQNFISPEAALLDKIQYENNVIFVVAGTNKKVSEAEKAIGSPADSINSIVVNSVNIEGDPASYSRRGIVLSFFNKPDVSTFGGDEGGLLRVCAPNGEASVSGTSYAAPWITRKLAYLIEVLGLSREVAKALIIDSATNWDDTGNNISITSLIGHGVVPIRIEDVIKTREDEIKFIIEGTSEKWDTFTYNLPIPMHNQKHPFLVKATLCYFPSCSINQGVDYTDTELDIYIGRVKGNNIQSIDKNKQSLDDGDIHYMTESNARKNYRKWDNTKHINEILTDRVRPRIAYTEDGLWGISVKSKNRISRQTKDLNFGLVVTLREMNGVNRIDDFIRLCELRGWLVNKVDVENQINVYSKSQEVIEFE